MADGAAAAAAEWWSTLKPGDRVFVKYDGDPHWHERIVVWPVGGGTFAILTPDDDVYCESLNRSDPDQDPVKAVLGPRDKSLPGGLRGPVYRFKTSPDATMLRSKFRKGLAEARAELKVFGIDAP